MRIFLPMLVAVLTMAMVPSGSRADEQKQPGPPRPGVIFERLDADKDGFLSADQLPDRLPDPLRAALRKADKDGDKQISREEFQQAVKGIGRQHRPNAPQQQRSFHGQRGKGGPPQRHGPGEFHSRSDAGPQAAYRAHPRGHKAMGHKAMGHKAVGHGRDMPGPGQVFDRLDRNHDGQLSRQEFVRGIERIRSAGGPPSRGRHSAAQKGYSPEQGPAAQRHSPGPGDVLARLKSADKDEDGKLSKAEAPPRLKAHFDRVDQNDDGQLGPKELRRAAVMAMRMRTAPGQRGGSEMKPPQRGQGPAWSDSPRDGQRPPWARQGQGQGRGQGRW